MTVFPRKNYKRGALADAQSVFSAILPKNYGNTFNQDKNIDQIMKGMLTFWPTFLRYAVTYNPDTVLVFMDSFPDNKYLNFQLHTKKFSKLLCLVVGNGCSLSKKSDWIMLVLQQRSIHNVPVILKTIKTRQTPSYLKIWGISLQKKFYMVDCIDKYDRRLFLLRKSQPDKQK